MGKRKKGPQNFNLEEQLDKLTECSDSIRSSLKEKIMAFQEEYQSQTVEPVKRGEPTYTVYLLLDPAGIPYVGHAQESHNKDSYKAILARAGKDGIDYMNGKIKLAFEKYKYDDFFKYGLFAGLEYNNAETIETIGMDFFDSIKNGYNVKKSRKSVIAFSTPVPIPTNIEPTITIIDTETMRFCEVHDADAAESALKDVCPDTKYLKKAVNESCRKKRLINDKYLCVRKTGMSSEEIRNLCEQLPRKGIKTIYVYFPAEGKKKNYKSFNEAASDTGLSVEWIKNRLYGRTPNTIDGATPFVSYNKCLESEYQVTLQCKQENAKVFCINLETNRKLSAQSPREMRIKLLEGSTPINVSEYSIRHALKSNTSEHPFTTLTSDGTLYIRAWRIKEFSEKIKSEFTAKCRLYYMYNARSKKYEDLFLSQKDLGKHLNLNHSTISNGVQKGRINEHLIFDHEPSQKELETAFEACGNIREKHDTLMVFDFNKNAILTFKNIAELVAELHDSYKIDKSNASRYLSHNSLLPKKGLAFSYDAWGSKYSDEHSQATKDAWKDLAQAYFDQGEYNSLREALGST